MVKMEMHVMTEAVETGSNYRRDSVFLVWFIPSAATTLVVTGAAKAWTGFGRTKILAVADPITGMQFGHLMLVVGILELAIGSICLFGKSQKLKLGLIAWLAMNFVVYRLGLRWMGWRKPCSCLGNRSPNGTCLL